jgi:hypothetical protein
LDINVQISGSAEAKGFQEGLGKELDLKKKPIPQIGN